MTHSRHSGELVNNKHIDNARYPIVGVHSETHGNYTLEGRILPIDNSPPKTMVIHGARADYTKGDALFPLLHTLGIPILGATTSGHGATGKQSTMNFSLDENLNEARAFARLLAATDNTLIGLSMGGTTAMRLAQEEPDKYTKLVLFYPAVFPDEAYNIPFGTNAFREVASPKDAFLSSSFFNAVAEFKGEIMLIKGQYDGLRPADYAKKDNNAVYYTTIDKQEVYSPIPPGVFKRILKVRPDTQYLEIPGADHRLMGWLDSHPTEAKALASKLYAFICDPHQ